VRKRIGIEKVLGIVGTACITDPGFDSSARTHPQASLDPQGESGNDEKQEQACYQPEFLSATPVRLAIAVQPRPRW
jgi:hypothetical protein